MRQSSKVVELTRCRIDYTVEDLRSLYDRVLRRALETLTNPPRIGDSNAYLGAVRPVPPRS
jgi:hypothetical protein